MPNPSDPGIRSDETEARRLLHGLRGNVHAMNMVLAMLQAMPMSEQQSQLVGMCRDELDSAAANLEALGTELKRDGESPRP